jgi:hypothetical protein
MEVCNEERGRKGRRELKKEKGGRKRREEKTREEAAPA